jgi:zinc transport system ATP-binding protein
MAHIGCAGLTVKYAGRAAISNVTFTVRESDFLVIAGSNGSGKSTLMKALLGLVPADSGSVVMEGISRSDIGYLPQQNDSQKDFPASVREVVLSGFLNRLGMRPFYSRAERLEASRRMERLGVLPLAHKSFQELSGGQRQRVLLARALCAARKMLFLDEPVTGLDPLITEEFYSALSELNGSGLGVIMVSHDVKRAVELASRVLHIDGELRFFGSPSDYKLSADWSALTRAA